MAIKSERISILARQENPIFHAQDLARLWNIQSSNTLHTLLKRYNERGLLFRIYKGLYSLQSLDKIDPMLLGIKALHSYAYVSTETILTQEGFIMQIIPQYTLVSNRSMDFTIDHHDFKSRQLQDKYLYNPTGIYEKNGILIATVERALADLFYFNPNIYLDGIERVDFKKLKKVQTEIGYK